MHRRMLGWLVIGAAVIGISSCVGIGVRVVIGVPTHNEAYRVNNRAAVVTYRPAPPYADLATRQPTTFGPSEPPPANDPLLTALSALPTISRNGNYFYPDTAFDTQRMTEEAAVLAATGKPGRTAVDLARQIVVNSVLSDRFRPGIETFNWSSTTVLGVAYNGTRTEARALAKHTFALDANTSRTEYRRYWLVRNPSWGWRVYDFDEPEGRVRFTLTIADGSRRDVGPSMTAPPVGPTVNLRGIFQQVAVGDSTGLAAKQWVLRREPLSPALTALRLAADGRVKVLAGDPAGALSDADSATRTWADTPTADLTRAAALVALNKPKDAIAALDRYRRTAGSEPDSVALVARATVASGNVPAAVTFLKQARKEFPTDPGLLALWAELAPADAGKVGEAITALPDPGPLLAKVVARVPAGSADKVIAGFRSVRLNDPFGNALAVARDPDGKTAGTSLTLAFANAGTRSAVAEALAAEAVRAGHPAKVYRRAVAVGEAKVLFPPLTAKMAADPKLAADLAAIGEEHRTSSPRDPWGHYHAGRAKQMMGDWAGAAAVFADAMDRLPQPPPTVGRQEPFADASAPPLPPEWESLRAARTECLFRAGKWRVAFDQVKPRRETFDQLAALAADTPNVLAAVIAAQEAVEPKDEELKLWQAELAYRAKKYEECLAILAQYNPQSERGQSQADERQVRCLLRLNQGAEAEAVPPHGRRSPLAAALVAGGHSDVAEATLHLCDWLAAGHTLAELHADPELGLLVRANKELAKAFPK